MLFFGGLDNFIDHRCSYFMECPLCNSSKLRFSDAYRFNVQYDKKFFGEPKLEVCMDCNLGFANPTPFENKLTDYYKNIYRSAGRPHYADPKSPPLPSHSDLGIINNLSSVVDLSNVSTILDIGAGWGAIGMLLLQHYPHINIYTVEPDKHCQEVLLERGYKVVESFKDIENCNAEVVISLHCLEHFSSPIEFVEVYKPYISNDAIMLLEVPNCRFGEGFEERPYDSPHLLFFNSESMNMFAKLNNFEIITMFTTGRDTKKTFEVMSNWIQEFGNWLPGDAKGKTLKNVIKSIIPPRIKDSIKALIGETSTKLMAQNFSNLSAHSPDRCNLRCILKAKG